MKLDTSGEILWQNTIGSDADDVLLSTDVTPEGGYNIGGASRSGLYYDKNETLMGDPDDYAWFDFWILKLFLKLM
jgi:hypothetical protein